MSQAKEKELKKQKAALKAEAAKVQVYTFILLWSTKNRSIILVQILTYIVNF